MTEQNAQIEVKFFQEEKKMQLIIHSENQILPEAQFVGAKYTNLISDKQSGFYHIYTLTLDQCHRLSQILQGVEAVLSGRVS